MSKFSDTLVYLRKRDHLSQEELAKKIGISRSTVAMMESGGRMPSRETLETVADLFNVSIDFLIGRSDSGENSSVFRENLARIIESSSKEDLMRAGINLYEVGLIIDGTISLSLDCACHLADQLGESLDSLLGRETLNAALGDEDGTLVKCLNIILSLSEDQKQEALNYVRYLADKEGS